jgi:hypothetical protein
LTRCASMVKLVMLVDELMGRSLHISLLAPGSCFDHCENVLSCHVGQPQIATWRLLVFFVHVPLYVERGASKISHAYGRHDQSPGPNGGFEAEPRVSRRFHGACASTLNAAGTQTRPVVGYQSIFVVDYIVDSMQAKPLDPVIGETQGND